MAVITSNPKHHSIGVDLDLYKDALAGKVDQFMSLVKKGTYPRSGMDHPYVAIGDTFEFSLESEHLKVLKPNAIKYTVTDIDLHRHPRTKRWVWVVSFTRKERDSALL